MKRVVTLLNTGKMRSGKDKSREILIANLLPKEFNFTHLALAKRVKEIAAEVLTELWEKEITAEMFDDPALKQELRQYAIIVGQAGRKINSETWIDLLKEQLRQNNGIVTDVRFENEFYKLKEVGGDSEDHLVITVRFKASDAVRIARGAQPELFNNPTETGLDHVPDSEFDYVVDNETDDEENLVKQLNPIAEQIKDYLYGYDHFPSPTWANVNGSDY